MPVIEDTSLIDLTRKLAMLMTLITSGQRAKTIHSIKVSIIQIIDKKVYMPIKSVIKQTKANKCMEPSSFMAYDNEPILSVVRLFKNETSNICGRQSLKNLK